MKASSVVLILVAVAVSMMNASIGDAKHAKPKYLNVPMYMQIIEAGPNATGLRVAGPGGELTENKFGTVFVFDDVLTELFDNTSKVIGRAKGTTMVTEPDASNATYAWCAVLRTEHYNGTISFQGVDNGVKNNQMEHAIVGGSGDFRFATGYANFTHVKVDIPNGLFTIFINASVYFPPWTLHLYSK